MENRMRTHCSISVALLTPCATMPAGVTKCTATPSHRTDHCWPSHAKNQSALSAKSSHGTTHCWCCHGNGPYLLPLGASAYWSQPNKRHWAHCMPPHCRWKLASQLAFWTSCPVMVRPLATPSPLIQIFAKSHSLAPWMLDVWFRRRPLAPTWRKFRWNSAARVHWSFWTMPMWMRQLR